MTSPSVLPPAADELLDQYFREAGQSGGLPALEKPLARDILDYVHTRFAATKYVLGLALDFVLLAERLSELDDAAVAARPNLTEAELFNRYRLIESVGTRKANTLTLEFAGFKEGIRKIEEHVASMFHRSDRSTYPSAYVYNTGQWHKYKDLLVLSFRLSRTARHAVARILIEYGLAKLPANTFYGRPTPRPRVFEHVVDEFERIAKGENGGLAFQALAFGFVVADRPHLSLVTSGVRTGSSRQKRIGDIDGYRGPDLELAVEVKDLAIRNTNYQKELSAFIGNVTSNGTLGMVIALDIEQEVRTALAETNIVVVSEPELRTLIATWDWPKLDAALLGMLHFLAHVEQNPSAVRRLLEFIRERDPHHQSLVYLNDDQQTQE